MVTIPGFLLRRLYVRGSLRNTESGAQFQLLNKLGSGYAQELLPLSVDGEDISLDRCTFAVDGTLFPFDAVSNDTPFTLDLNKATTINLSGGSPIRRAPHHRHGLQGPRFGHAAVRFPGRSRQ